MCVSGELAPGGRCYETSRLLPSPTCARCGCAAKQRHLSSLQPQAVEGNVGLHDEGGPPLTAHSFYIFNEEKFPQQRVALTASKIQTASSKQRERDGLVVIFSHCLTRPQLGSHTFYI